ncbi:hypothetical protein [Haloarcula laminariae]|uniref:hypothetical protein n=1 Tax=Haloarcula laminariae TaxID=2961577 RepID=UPI002406DE27|nr:hypothetical protein [Halomicroarcula sp. FL173]
MTVYEKTTGGEVYLRGIDRDVSAGDRVTVDDEDFAAYLQGRGDFRPVDVQDAEFRDVDGDDSTSSSGDGFDADAWLDQDYQQRADRVREGGVDEHLDTIDDIETSDTVRDAIGERRAELEG